VLIWNMLMEGKNMPEKQRQPEIIVFAGPNGSGKSTITKFAKTVGIYINADEIKKANHCSDLEAAQIAEKLREEAVQKGNDFTFETVLSTRRNLDLLKKAKQAGYFIKCFYVLTADVEVNVMRVKAREMQGGHGVPEEKIRSRFDRAIGLIPELTEVCDILHIYDNTIEPYRIFKKRKTKYYYWPNIRWNEKDIAKLTGVSELSIWDKQT